MDRNSAGEGYDETGGGRGGGTRLRIRVETGKPKKVVPILGGKKVRKEKALLARKVTWKDASKKKGTFYRLSRVVFEGGNDRGGLVRKRRPRRK